MLWPIHQINWQRSRYIYDMHYKFKRISRPLYDYCLREKYADAQLCSKWKKPGYARLCSIHVINPQNTNFGTTSICRVPRQQLARGVVVEDATTGCRGCAPGPGGYNNIFGNRYGQYLAAIQVKREAAAKEAGRTYDPAEDDWNFDQEGGDEEEGGASSSSVAAGSSASSSSGAAAASVGDGGKRKRAAASGAADIDDTVTDVEGGVKRSKQTET